MPRLAAVIPLLAIALVAIALVAIALVAMPAMAIAQSDESDAPAPAAKQRARVPDAVRVAPFPVTADGLAGSIWFLSHPRLGGRAAGSEGAAIAATYIASELHRAGLEPAGPDGGWEQPFVVPSRRVVKVGPPRPPYESRNVLGWLPGRDPELAKQHIIVGAHFDHLGAAGLSIYPGADDNASGVAGLLGIARALANAEPRPRRSVLVIAFGAEEVGLVGSRHYLSAPVRPISELVLMVNLDMIGRPVFLDRERFRVAKRLVGIGDGPAVGLLGDTPRTLEIARAACRIERLPAYRPADFPFLERYLRRRTGGRDDSAPFRALGLPTVFFSTGEHDDYHQPTDTFDTVDPEMVRRIAAAAWRTILAIDAMDDPSILRVAEKAQDGNESENETENGGR